MSCVWMLQRVHSGDGCVLSSTLFMYDLRKGDLFCYELGKGVTSGTEKYLFINDNVWWRCAQYVIMPLGARCIEKIYVCIWRMLVFMSVVVAVWGYVGMFGVYRPFFKIVFFSLWSIDVCSVFV